MSYLNHADYGAALGMLTGLRHNGKQFCWTIKIGTTHERKPIYGLRIHNGRAKNPRAVLIVGGAHAREMIPPEAVLLFAWKICRSYANGNDLKFGDKEYPGSIASLLVETLEIIVVPMLNPDGRAWVETTDKDWRKNRRPGPTPTSCRGVDINRNYDFLFNSGLGTSDYPCEYQVYRGPSAHSEPEVKAIRDLISQRRNIRGVLDVHAFKGLILYPWGDDQNQSTNPAMNFLNSIFDGQRGIKNDSYREHITSDDLRWYEETAIRMRDRVKEVAKRDYTAQPGIDLYATSATLSDYSYSRHLADPIRTKVMGMAVELGFEADGGFRPNGAVAQTIRNEGVVLIIEFCLALMCTGDAVLSTSVLPRKLAEELREMREGLRETPAGRRYIKWSEVLAYEVILRLTDPSIAKDIAPLAKDFRKWWTAGNLLLGTKTADQAKQFLLRLRQQASKDLRHAIDAFVSDIDRMTGKSSSRAFEIIRARATKKSSKK